MSEEDTSISHESNLCNAFCSRRCPGKDSAVREFCRGNVRCEAFIWTFREQGKSEDNGI